MKYEMYTDGSSVKYKGQYCGGAAFVCVAENNYSYQWSSQLDGATNNYAELYAIRQAITDCVRFHSLLSSMNNEFTAVIYTDSAYALNSINTWMWKWVENDWVKSDGRVIENLDLIEEIYHLMKFGRSYIKIEKVKAHAGIRYNEAADSLAREAAEDLIRIKMLKESDTK